MIDGPNSLLQDVDIYDRTIADVYVNGNNVAEILRSEGFAKTRYRYGLSQ